MAPRRDADPRNAKLAKRLREATERRHVQAAQSRPDPMNGYRGGDGGGETPTREDAQGWVSGTRCGATAGERPQLGSGALSSRPPKERGTGGGRAAAAAGSRPTDPGTAAAVHPVAAVVPVRPPAGAGASAGDGASNKPLRAVASNPAPRVGTAEDAWPGTPDGVHRQSGAPATHTPTDAPGPREDPVPAGRAAAGRARPEAEPTRPVSATALPAPSWYCVDHDAVHVGECPALTPRHHRPLLLRLFDLIGRPA